MSTLGGIFVLFLAFAGIVAIGFFIYALKWNIIEKQVRKALQKEFDLKIDQAFAEIEQHREKQKIEIDRFSNELREKLEKEISEAEKLQEKNIQHGKNEAKTIIFAALNQYVQDHYLSNQTKTKLNSFVAGFAKNFKF